MPDSRPSATVTFLFTDLEGSTRRWEAQREAMSAALARHDALVRAAIEAHGGRVFKTVGDAFCAAFESAPDALTAALAAQQSLAAEDWRAFGPHFASLRARMAIHTGLAEARDDDFFGPTVNRVARLLAAGHGGQVLVSRVTEELAEHHLPGGATLRDLGEHRLKDLDRPERIFQLAAAGLEADFPPLRTLDAFRHNLPVQLTRFIGRAADTAAIRDRLAEERLVTLAGVGGSGKTRLALQVAAEAIDAFPDGAWFVELAPLADPELVAQTVAGALGVREEPGRSIETTLGDAVRAKRLLLVLDNCEHLLGAAAALVDSVLRAAPELRVLATSREPLGVAGESVWRVAPLPTAPSGERDVAVLGQYEAVQLFVERAAAVRSDFTVTPANAAAIADICHRLDGIPLALELAAARIQALSPEQIAERLDERFRLLTGGVRTALPRQQTLRAAVDWSYDLLPDVERRVLERMAVFATGCRLDAAEAVCADEAFDAFEVVDALGNLVAKSLVIADEDGGAARYRLLETIRQYAMARLADASEDAAARDRHLAWYAALMGQMEDRIKGDDQMGWLLSVEHQHNDIRAAVAWGLDDGARLPQLLALTAPLWRFWTFRGYFREAIDVIERVLGRADGTAGLYDLDHVAWLKIGRGQMFLALGRYDASEIDFAEARDRFASSGNLLGLGWALYGLGWSAMNRYDADLDAATRFTEAGRRVLLDGGLERDAFHTLVTLGDIARIRCDWDRAEALNEECLSAAPAQRDGDVALEALWPLHNLGWIAIHRGAVEDARDRFAASLGPSQRLGVPGQLGGALAGLAAVALHDGAGADAVRLLAASRTVFDAAGYVIPEPDRTDWEGTVERSRAALDAAAWDAAWAEGAAMPFAEAVALAEQVGSRP